MFLLPSLLPSHPILPPSLPPSLPSPSVVTASKNMAYKSIRDSFSHQVAIILSCYRKNCSNQSPAGQLILPESLKLLPMYANCLLKSDALLSRTSACSGCIVYPVTIKPPVPIPQRYLGSHPQMLSGTF